MEYEIELKLTTTGQVGELIESYLLPNIAARVEKQELELSNSYFDTSQRDFRQNGMGLRIRGSQHEYEQTIKTAGNGVAGLAQRPEYNVALGKGLSSPPTIPDLSLFPAEIWPVNFNLLDAQAQLHCLFETHFSRTVYLLSYDQHSQIELVWDRGLIKANDKQEDINEVELELKQGSVNQLFVLARQITAFMPLKIGLLSKAARGYRLLKANSKPDKSALQPMVDVSESIDTLAQLPILHDYLAKHLNRWQQLINQFETTPNEQNLSYLVVAWQQLCLLLNKCCKINTQQNSLQLKTDSQQFNDAWLLLLNSKEEAKMPTEAQYSRALELLTGKKAILLQLAIMQYLSQQQPVQS